MKKFHYNELQPCVFPTKMQDRKELPTSWPDGKVIIGNVEPQPVPEPKPESNEIWFEADNEEFLPYLEKLGLNIVSCEFDGEKWVAKFDGEVTEIPDNFIEEEDYSLTKIVLPDSVVRIGKESFMNAQALTSVTFGSGLKVVDDYAFQSTKIEKAVFKDGLEYVGQFAFNYCLEMTEMHLPDSVTHFGDFAFVSCQKLKKANIPTGITEVPVHGLGWCYELEEITIPNTITKIGNAAFQFCKSLKHVEIPEGVTYIDQSAFSDCIALTSVTLPSTLETIGNSAFAMCGFTGITIPEGVTGIGNSFSNCENLESIKLPASLPYLGSYAFQGCIKLASVEFEGDNLNSVGSCAFINCSQLSEIKVNHTMYQFAPGVSSNTFQGISDTGTLIHSADCDFSSWMNYLGSNWTEQTF